MKKEEILKRSREEKGDEGLLRAENKGRTSGFIAFSIVFVIIIVFDAFWGNYSQAPYAMFWAFVAAEAYPKYRFTKEKIYLLSAIAGAIASAVSLVSHIIVSLR